jgi:hypothetical protein
MRTFLCAALILSAQQSSTRIPTPTVDHHQHLYSAETIQLAPRSVN